jgi:hypothetical protein
VELTTRQIELARHALGLPNRRRCSYRNHFVADESHSDRPDWEEMVQKGAARKHKVRWMVGDVFVLTPEGARAALKTRERLDPEDFPK